MNEAQPNQRPVEGGNQRERSSIEFPYMGLDDAVEVAKAIHSTTGSAACQQDQLAAALNLSTSSSGFRVRLATAKMFGLIESERGAASVRLTDLGHQIVDPAQEAGAKVDAFLAVPLYKKIYDDHRNKTLPPPAALERYMGEIGVAKKQTDRARQTFDRSAQTAGFYGFGRDKLIMPPNTGGGVKDDFRGGGGSGGGNGGGDGEEEKKQALDPVIAALIQKLPTSGPWKTADREAWLSMMKMAFDMAYGANAAPPKPTPPMPASRGYDPDDPPF